MGSSCCVLLWNWRLGDSPFYYGWLNLGFVSIALVFPQKHRFKKMYIWWVYSTLHIFSSYVYCLGCFLWQRQSGLLCIVCYLSHYSYDIMSVGPLLVL